MLQIPKKTYKIRQILETSSLPRIETEILIAFLIEKTREYVLTHIDQFISPQIFRRFFQMENKRINNWPIAYLVGYKEFYNLKLKVSPAVLVPRPESEMIIDEILYSIEKKTLAAEPHLIDLGTGSGAIIISAAQEIKRTNYHLFKKIKFSAVDISSSALKIAKINAAGCKLSTKISFLKGNLLKPLKLNSADSNQSRLIIAANLPYLTLKQIKESPSICREPKIALNGGQDGLKYYRELFNQITRLNLKKTGITIFCEIDDSQAEGIKNLAIKYFRAPDYPDLNIKIKKDLAGLNRLAIIKPR